MTYDASLSREQRIASLLQHHAEGRIIKGDTTAPEGYWLITNSSPLASEAFTWSSPALLNGAPVKSLDVRNTIVDLGALPMNMCSEIKITGTWYYTANQTGAVGLQARGEGNTPGDTNPGNNVVQMSVIAQPPRSEPQQALYMGTQAVPTLSEYAMIALVCAVVAIAWRILHARLCEEE